MIAVVTFLANDHVGLYGVTVDGNRDNQNFEWSATDSQFQNGGANAIASFGASHVVIQDVVAKNAITDGLLLGRGSSRPHVMHTAFPPDQAERLKALLHQSPRCFGRPTSIWTLDLAAEVSFAAGLTAEQVSGETIRATLARLGVRWQRAKDWNTSPDPAYARKKDTATG